MQRCRKRAEPGGWQSARPAGRTVFGLHRAFLLATGLAPAAGLTFLCFAKEKISKRKASQRPWPYGLPCATRAIAAAPTTATKTAAVPTAAATPSPNPLTTTATFPNLGKQTRLAAHRFKKLLSKSKKPNWVFQLPFTPAGVKGRGGSGGQNSGGQACGTKLYVFLYSNIHPWPKKNPFLPVTNAAAPAPSGWANVPRVQPGTPWWSPAQ